MVVFVDLDRDDSFTEHQLLQHGSPLSLQKPFSPNLTVTTIAPTRSCGSSPSSEAREGNGNADPTTSPPTQASEAENPNCNAFSAALSCYPIVKEIARAVDLNTLHALSRTCRQFHVNLAPFRRQLVRETLRCENEYIETVADMLDGKAIIPNSVKSVLQLLSQSSGGSGRMTRGKVGRCARDMVGECRRCSKIVCRNCTIKPPSQTAIKGRIRRLCRSCGAAPLSYHLSNVSHESDFFDKSNRVPSTVADEIARATGICNCNDALWLCQQCGQTLRSNDTTYRRVWAWRTRYSTYLGGGLGTGIGEGSQGVKCGRGQACLAAKEIELEVDCEADEAASDASSSGHSPPSHAPHHHEQVSTDGHGHDEEEPGYFRQEIIGLGGLMKQKAKKRVLVGACVVEYEDERETGRYLEREENGVYRAWCGWCSRVIPAKDEIV